MSQLSSTVFGSWGLMVGWNIAPPPPGPMISKFPGRCVLPLIATRRIRVSRNKNDIIVAFLCFLYHFFAFFLAEIHYFVNVALACGDCQSFWLCLSSAAGRKSGGEGMMATLAQSVLFTWLAGGIMGCGFRR